MKTIPNVTYTLKLDQERYGTTASLLSICIKNPPPGGFDLAEMRARNRIADVVEKTPERESIFLEDADYSTAARAVGLMRWGQYHPDLLAFGKLFGL